jgi:hypothetical protein
MRRCFGGCFRWQVTARLASGKANPELRLQAPRVFADRVLSATFQQQLLSMLLGRNYSLFRPVIDKLLI